MSNYLFASSLLIGLVSHLNLDLSLPLERSCLFFIFYFYIFNDVINVSIHYMLLFNNKSFLGELLGCI